MLSIDNMEKEIKNNTKNNMKNLDKNNNRINFGLILRHYKKRWIQEEILLTAKSREVAIRYLKGFGKRPDSLFYPNDIFENAKQQATSFHISEERWRNPLSLSTNLKKHELDELRIGWDLVIDVDYKEWEGCKIIADSIIRALREHGIKNISVKFSGNKGFHIGVPFESFPNNIGGKPLSYLFPDGVKKIVEYLVHYIDNEKNNYELSRKLLEINNKAKKSNKGLNKELDDELDNENSKEKKYTYICSRCGYRKTLTEYKEFIKCEKCGFISELEEDTIKENKKKTRIEKINLNIDTMLITQRHLYRSVFSLHEKSGLVSIPINPDKILEFEREIAQPNNIPNERTHFYLQYRFLDINKSRKDEAKKLLISALDWRPRVIIEDEEKRDKIYRDRIYIDNLKGEKIPEEMFPPAIKDILKGLEDGRKRALFILMNFLNAVNWKYDEIEKKIYEWNEKNRDPLRESYIKGQLNQLKKQKTIMLPPNYDNDMYYKDLKIGTEDERLKNKNPVQVAKRIFLMTRKRRKKK